MDEHAETLIEQYVLCPETLSAEARASVVVLLGTSETARAVATFYREFYLHLRGLPPLDPDPRSLFLITK